jgi:hypothetical protein
MLGPTAGVAWRAKDDLCRSLKGIGRVVSATLLTLLPEPGPSPSSGAGGAGERRVSVHPPCPALATNTIVIMLNPIERVSGNVAVDLLRAYVQKEKLMQSELYRSIFAEGKQEGERLAIMDLCEILGIELTPERRAQIEQLDPAHSRASSGVHASGGGSE